MADPKKVRHPDVNTALHVLKGAIVKVLHTPLTTGTEAQKKNEGRISVEYSLDNAPTKEQLNKIEELANDKIKEKVEIKYFKMERSAAEEKYSKNLVNETYIYDKFPVPPEIKEVNIVEIPDWNVNCSAGPLLSNTGEIKPIKIKRTNHRATKKELEFVFELVESNSTPTEQKPATKTTNAKTKLNTAPQKEYDNVMSITNSILEEVFKELKLQGVDLKEKEALVSKTLTPRIEQKLTTLKNTAYGHGFSCAPDRTKML